MISRIHAELLKLGTTRAIRGLLVAALAVAGLLGAATAGTAGGDEPSLGTAGNLANVVGASGLPAFVMMILGILAMAGEYQHRTVTSTFLSTPRRGGVLVAKLVALAGVGLAVALAIMGVALAAALPPMLIDGTTVDLMNRSVLAAFGGNLVAGALFGVLGVSLGAVVRNQLAAVTVAILWAFLIEGVVSVFVGADAVRWLPGFAAQAVVAGGTDLLPLWAAALLLAGYATLGALVAARLTISRDVT
jgi:ABC-type transport system involved in multi-copper enzyme maturation permease subunit